MRTNTQTHNKPLNWMAGANTLDDLKKLYRVLAFRYHPDRPGGDTATMQQINAEFEQAKRLLEAPAAGRRYSAPGSKQNNNTNHAGQPSAAAIQAAILARYLCPGVHIEYQGAEVIARGATYENREKLKELGYWWSAEHRYWHFVRRPGTRGKGAA
jgi:hypothetical protein